MGQVLQIRVMAQTYDESEVEKKWPHLVESAWQLPQPPGLPHGVLELVDDLKGRLDLGMMSADMTENLSETVREAYNLKVRLEKALGDWKASEANTISYDLEDVLSAAERIAAKIKDR
ncbi:hypothetical protein [Maridesulfovibrio zosterae]|uniref:hypothetical protein n=1 Tax=Maridesulfovibrio zosterae TaxID=82171 RepID=UPI0003F73A48|nr:hypothetical protein [Maridesulfovibrio zosterae]